MVFVFIMIFLNIINCETYGTYSGFQICKYIPIFILFYESVFKITLHMNEILSNDIKIKEGK